MSDDKATEAAPKKKKKGKLLIIVIGVLVVAGGGAGAGLYASQSIGGGHKEEAEDEHKPKLVPREDVDEEVAMRTVKGKDFDRTKFKATYYPLKDSFTANLSDGESFIQAGMGVATYYDEKVTKAVETHEMAIRSAILMTLSEEDPMEVSEPAGKDALRKKLRDSVNQVLESKEGFGGIDDVYFTSFVVQ